MPTADFTPTVEDLAFFMRARAKTRYGATVGTFDDTTPVTADQAAGLIDEALNEVAIAVGPNMPVGPDDDPDLYKNGAKALVLLLASMNVEITLAPEQVNDPRSPYAALERRYNNFHKALIEAVAEAQGGAAGEGESAATAASGLPAGHFPPSSEFGTRPF
jgi:hypothetical protein